MKTIDNKLRKWKNKTRLFRTYTTWDKKVRMWGRRCRIVWWKPCDTYFGTAVPSWYNQCSCIKGRYEDTPGEHYGVCPTYGYQPRYGKISHINCNEVLQDSYWTVEEIEEMKKDGRIVKW